MCREVSDFCSWCSVGIEGMDACSSPCMITAIVPITHSNIPFKHQPAKLSEMGTLLSLTSERLPMRVFPEVYWRTGRHIMVQVVMRVLVQISITLGAVIGSTDYHVSGLLTHAGIYSLSESHEGPQFSLATAPDLEASPSWWRSTDIVGPAHKPCSCPEIRLLGFAVRRKSLPKPRVCARKCHCRPIHTGQVYHKGMSCGWRTSCYGAALSRRELLHGAASPPVAHCSPLQTLQAARRVGGMPGPGRRSANP